MTHMQSNTPTLPDNDVEQLLALTESLSGINHDLEFAGETVRDLTRLALASAQKLDDFVLAKHPDHAPLLDRLSKLEALLQILAAPDAEELNTQDAMKSLWEHCHNLASGVHDDLRSVHHDSAAISA
ncbi:MAG: hypothetical protein ACWA44_10790 [Thiotrichales bacterium]